jgi:hypothetical protein
VENLIITIRGERVLLDSDVAMLYGVETRRINEAVSNNSDISDMETDIGVVKV